MTTREKIIVSIMCLTIIYGAYELFGARRTRTAAPAAPSRPAVDLKNFVVEVAQKLDGRKIAEDYPYMITKASTAWPKDPFLKSTDSLKASLKPVVPSAPKTRAAPGPSFSYTGYLSLGTTKLAIINGLEYAEGEALPVADYFVKTIYENRVVLARIDGSDTIQLPIKDLDFDVAN